MAAPERLRNVVFDIGWVLVRLNYRPLLELLQAHGAQLADRNAVMTGIRLEDHETGRLPGQGLLERLRGLTRKTVSLEETRVKWLDMFELEPAMIELAHRLSEHYRVFLLSNIGDLHWAHLAREYRLHGVGHGALPSYVAGVMKPHPQIYAEAERRFALEPAMIELAHRLSERYRVFLLSNIGDLHWTHLAREYRLHAIGHGALPSYVAGVMKPHPGIYAEAERRFALEPAATVFIDDLAANVATARGRGWHGIVHRDQGSTVAGLEALGVGTVRYISSSVRQAPPDEE